MGKSEETKTGKRVGLRFGGIRIQDFAQRRKKTSPRVEKEVRDYPWDRKGCVGSLWSATVRTICGRPQKKQGNIRGGEEETTLSGGCGLRCKVMRGSWPVAHRGAGGHVGGELAIKCRGILGREERRTLRSNLDKNSEGIKAICMRKVQ